MEKNKESIDQLINRYAGYRKEKVLILAALGVLTLLMLILSISSGSVKIPFFEVIKSLLEHDNANRWDLIVWEIRLPHALSALFAGLGLAVSGVAMQAILNNPLGSPFTLGISHAAAFGAAFSVIVLGTGATQSSAGEMVKLTNHYLTTFTAFFFCMIEAGVVLLIARLKKTSPEIMVLAGVALGSLFSAGVMFLQYFADDIQLASMVFWTFGDVSRAGWKEVNIIMVVSVIALIYYLWKSWDYNALSLGDESAKSLGIHVTRIRACGMAVSVIVTAVIISFLGIIGFVGLICPHMIRRLIGNDHRWLIPSSALFGAVLLMGADTAAKSILSPIVLPVAVLTSFLGAPLFIWLLLGAKK